MMEIDLLKYEKALYKEGINLIAGVDEVGRGPLCGPVVAACVILPKNYQLAGLNDSKKLSEKKRNQYYEILKKDLETNETKLQTVRLCGQRAKVPAV